MQKLKAAKERKQLPVLTTDARLNLIVSPRQIQTDDDKQKEAAALRFEEERREEERNRVLAEEEALKIREASALKFEAERREEERKRLLEEEERKQEEERLQKKGEEEALRFEAERKEEERQRREEEEKERKRKEEEVLRFEEERRREEAQRKREDDEEKERVEKEKKEEEQRKRREEEEEEEAKKKQELAKEAHRLKEVAEKEAHLLKEAAEKEAHRLKEAAEKEAHRVKEAAEKEAHRLKEAAEKEAHLLKEAQKKEAAQKKKEQLEKLKREEEERKRVEEEEKRKRIDEERKRKAEEKKEAERKKLEEEAQCKKEAEEKKEADRKKVEEERKRKAEVKAAGAAGISADGPVCHDCKTVNKSGYKFCDVCGAKPKEIAAISPRLEGKPAAVAALSSSVFDRLARKEEEEKEEKKREEKERKEKEEKEQKERKDKEEKEKREMKEKDEKDGKEALEKSNDKSLLICHDCKNVNKLNYKFCDVCGAKSKHAAVDDKKAREEEERLARIEALQKARADKTSADQKRASFAIKDLPKLKLTAIKPAAPDSSDEEQDGDDQPKACNICGVRLSDGESFCSVCQLDREKSMASSSTIYVPFKSARGVQGSPFLRRKIESKIALASSSNKAAPAVDLSPRRNMSNSRMGSSSNINRSMSKLSGTSALLLWCQKRISDCEAPSGWKTGWSDGLALCSLARHFFPDAIDFATLRHDTDELEARMSNCQTALKLFETNGVPMLIEAEDLAEQAVAEPRSLQTFLSEIRKRLDPDPNDATNTPGLSRRGDGSTPMLGRKPSEAASTSTPILLRRDQ